MSRTMSVSRGLSELKLLDSKITRAIQTTNYITVKKAKSDKVFNGMKSIEDYTKETKASYQSIVDLLEERKKIKSAIVKSNAETMIEINGKKYTVADAIERKTSISYEKEFLTTIKRNYGNATMTLESHNQKLENDIARMIEGFVGKDSKSDKDIVETATRMADSKRENEKMEFVDPLGVANLIQAMENDIEEFSSEVDLCLSESNATTTIIVD